MSAPRWCRVEPPSQPQCGADGCVCGKFLPPDDLRVAAVQPHAMVNDWRDVFYPDNPDDAAYFAQHHDARPLHPDAFRETFGAPS